MGTNMLEMMSGLEKQQQLTVAHAAGTFRVEQLTLRPMSTAPEGHVLLCKTKHEDNVYLNNDTGNLTAYGANVEGFGHADDGWHLLTYLRAGTFRGRRIPDSARWTPACWCMAATDRFVPANPIGWVLDLGGELTRVTKRSR